MAKKERDYYKQIDEVLSRFENCKPICGLKMGWVTRRIDWCWKFRKITREQFDELVERAIAVFNSPYWRDFDIL